MREAALAVIELGFRFGFERIEAMSDARHTCVARLPKPLGTQRKGLLRRHERDPQGQLCNMVLYAVLKPYTQPSAADDRMACEGTSAHRA